MGPIPFSSMNVTVGIFPRPTSHSVLLAWTFSEYTRFS